MALDFATQASVGCERQKERSGEGDRPGPTSPELMERVTPPYLAYRTLKNFLDALKKGIPGRIDRSVLSNLSGGAQSMLIGALRFFALIEADGTPTDTLE